MPMPDESVGADAYLPLPPPPPSFWPWDDRPDRDPVAEHLRWSIWFADRELGRDPRRGDVTAPAHPPAVIGEQGR